MRSRTIGLLIAVALLSALPVLRTGPRAAAPAAAAAAFQGGDQIFQMVNSVRLSHGLSPLSRDPRLDAEATDFVNFMCAANFFGLVGPDGRSILQRFIDHGYSPSGNCFGTNIAGGYHSESEVVNAWMGSSITRANILMPCAQDMGAGTVICQGITLLADMDVGKAAPPPPCPDFVAVHNDPKTGVFAIVRVPAVNAAVNATVVFVNQGNKDTEVTVRPDQGDFTITSPKKPVKVPKGGTVRVNVTVKFNKDPGQAVITHDVSVSAKGDVFTQKVNAGIIALFLPRNPGPAPLPALLRVEFPKGPLHLKFPDTKLNNKSGELCVEIKDVGDQILNVTVAKTPAAGTDFEITSDTLFANGVPVGPVGGQQTPIGKIQSRRVCARFTPTTKLGQLTDVISIMSNDPFNPSFDVGLIGCAK
jgi:hypothetical protein